MLAEKRRLTSSNETALEGIALDPVQAYLASLGMTAGELLIGNLALAVTGMAALTFGLQVAEKALKWVAKKRGADHFSIPVAWRSPAPQIMVFFMMYPGCVQTCLTVIQSECTTWPYPVLAGFTIVGIPQGLKSHSMRRMTTTMSQRGNTRCSL